MIVRTRIMSILGLSPSGIYFGLRPWEIPRAQAIFYRKSLLLLFLVIFHVYPECTVPTVYTHIAGRKEGCLSAGVHERSAGKDWVIIRPNMECGILRYGAVWCCTMGQSCKNKTKKL